ncbi:tyrosine-type recombinase/integrase, partial [Kocuria sp. ZOR0020]|uniref:tyrosine-type recombinase/integrase n=1 Tax=Kocuria sp. ZOR0020 TaxID=1339234 RepID=UPI0018CCC188
LTARRCRDRSRGLPRQVRDILTACSTTGRNPLTRSRDTLLFHLLWETGMRIGEALNLQHRDISTGRGETPWIEVIARQTHPHGLRGKTSTPRRIYISDELENAYTAHLWALIDTGIDIDVPNLAAHPVFVNVVRDPRWAPMRAETVYQKTRAIHAHLQPLPRFTPHWFRHTHATTLLMAGTPPHVVMRRLGHSDVQTTLNTYGWVTEDAELRALGSWQTLTESWRGLA